MPELSIIVPIYNVEQYLSRCIDSILAQKHEDYELILINDGSTDLSGDIINQYAARDKRIVSIFQANCGVSSARNRGLEVAKGKYVSFIDADDWIEETMFSDMLYFMKKKGVDIICCNWKRNYEDGKEEKHVTCLEEGIMTAEQFVCHIFDRPRTIGGSNCNKLFLREKIQEHFDETTKICEDNIFLLNYCKAINNAYYLDKAFYHIYERSDSATRGTVHDCLHVLKLRKQMIYVAGKIGIQARNAAESDYLDQCNMYLHQENLELQQRKEIRKILWTYCRKYFVEILLNKQILWKLKLLYLLS